MNDCFKFDQQTYFQFSKNQTNYSKHMSEQEITATI